MWLLYAQKGGMRDVPWPSQKDNADSCFLFITINNDFYKVQATFFFRLTKKNRVVWWFFVVLKSLETLVCHTLRMSKQKSRFTSAFIVCVLPINSRDCNDYAV